MTLIEERPGVSKAALWGGWILSLLPALFLLMGSVTSWNASPHVIEGMAKFGYTARILRPLCVIEFLCAVLYLIPRTAVFGAILFTAYLGGAVATHARIYDPLWVVPVVLGIVVWIGLLLRKPHLRPMIFRS